MDEITPDIVAQVASRLYNQQPHSSLPQSSRAPGSDSSHMPSAAQVPHATHVAQGPQASTLPELSTGVPHGGMHSQNQTSTPPMAAPAAASTHASSSPNPFGSIPNVPTSPFGGSFPSVPSSIPHLPISPPTSFPPEIPSTPTFAGAPPTPTNTPDGLSAFVAGIRKTHFGGREQHIGGTTAQNFREGLSVGKAIPTMGARPLDVPAIRKDFPILNQQVHGKQLVWFDNAATTQKPQSVIDAISHFYENDYSNIHRAAHSLAARATDAYEKARQKVQSFLGAANVKEIIFVRGTTEGINLIAQTYGKKFLQPGDEIVMSQLEHHANIVPWQMVAKEKGAHIRVIPVNDRGEVMLEEYQKLLGPRTKVVALTHASNSLGTILPIHEMTQMAKRYNARVLIDGAQSVAHIPVNMQQLGADFFVFSGHKIFAPTGIGAVYIKEELHDIVPPWQGGGNMIRNVTFEETSFAEAPNKFEAGTPNIADAVGLGAALDYVTRLGLPNIAAYEHELLEYATEHMSRIPGVHLVGTAREKVGVLSFVLPNRRTEDIGRYLDQEGIAVRSGHHCSQPSLRRFGLETTVRPSLAFYNTKGEIDRLVAAVRRIQTLPG